MKHQKDNFEYITLSQIGIWAKPLPTLNTDNWVKILYNIQQNTSTAKKSNIGGYQTPANLPTLPIFFPLVKTLNSEIFEITKNPNIQIEGMWGNISSFTNFNSIHTHHTNIKKLSGVLYLQTPSNSGDIIFHNPLDLSIAFNVKPKPKTLIIFPSYLPHFVEPNLSQEDRISIAFNFN
jgi:uncharacterized protein (TIGR02466 family)